MITNLEHSHQQSTNYSILPSQNLLYQLYHTILQHSQHPNFYFPILLIKIIFLHNKIIYLKITIIYNTTHYLLSLSLSLSLSLILSIQQQPQHLLKPPSPQTHHCCTTHTWHHHYQQPIIYPQHPKKKKKQPAMANQTQTHGKPKPTPMTANPHPYLVWMLLWDDVSIIFFSKIIHIFFKLFLFNILYAKILNVTNCNWAKWSHSPIPIGDTIGPNYNV